jgi:hypothetical protein
MLKTQEFEMNFQVFSLNRSRDNYCWLKNKIKYFLCNRTRNEHFAYVKRLTTAVKVNVILIFDKF